jgi:hypothetical protein
MNDAAQRPKVDWAEIRRAYELTDETIKSLCLRFDVSKGAFDNHYRKGGWLSRQAARHDSRRSAQDRLFGALERQVAKLANDDSETLGEKETQQLTELVKNFERLARTRTEDTGPAGPPEKASNGGPADNKNMPLMRKLLAERIDQRNRR